MQCWIYKFWLHHLLANSLFLFWAPCPSQWPDICSNVQDRVWGGNSDLFLSLLPYRINHKALSALPPVFSLIYLHFPSTLTSQQLIPHYLLLTQTSLSAEQMLWFTTQVLPLGLKHSFSCPELLTIYSWVPCKDLPLAEGSDLTLGHRLFPKAVCI